MTRVGIVTINDDQNHGNRLQNYALQEFLREQGYTPTTVLNRPHGPTLSGVSRIASRDFIHSQRPVRGFAREVGRHLRGASMRRFDRRYLQVTDAWVEEGATPTGLAESFDLFVVGSDQVWNPRWRGTELDFLTFAPPEKRISYAASFGVSVLPPEAERHYADRLSGMRAISVRETEAAELVKRMTGRHVPVHVDPVLLLTPEQWRGVTGLQHRRESRERPVLTYFLGPESAARAELVDGVVRRLDARVVRFRDRRQPYHYVKGPAQFVAEIDAAALIITDSFHAAAFSILFGKPFVVVPREGVDEIGSRIRTLLRTFPATATTAGGLRSLPGVVRAESAATSQTLEVERQRARDYFRAASSG